MSTVQHRLKQPLRLRSFLPMMIPVLLAIALRLYKITETIRFNGDQGMDLIIVWHMEHAGHWPLVGPFLSLKDFYTPPTYYYITWLFYHFTHTVTGVVFGYFLINIAALIVFMKLAWNMGGKQLALIAGVLFAVSFTMIEHGRQFWQPFPMQLFIIISLWQLWRAFEKKSLLSLWISSLSYMLAVSVYPSPIMLLPYMAYQITRWHRDIHKLPLIKSLFFAGCIVVITFIIMYAPQIVFEISHQWPSLQFTDSLAGDSDAPTLFNRICENIFNFLSSFFGAYILFPKETHYVVSFIIITFVAITKWGAVPQKIRLFLAPFPLATGLAFFVLYRYDVFDHRMWSYFPFVFLFVSVAIHQALTSKKADKKIIAIVLLVTYSILNLSGFYQYATGKIINETEEASSIAAFVTQSMSTRKLSPYNTGFFHKTPLHPDNNTYSIYRVFYWLVEAGTFYLPLVPEGNKPAFNYYIPELKEYMYIICQRYPGFEEAQIQCVNSLIDASVYTTIETKNIGRAHIFILRDETLSPSSSDAPNSNGNFGNFLGLTQE